MSQGVSSVSLLSLEKLFSFETLGFVVGLAGLIAAIWALRAAHQTDAIIKEMKGFVLETKSALSTTHIGPFPDFMEEISKALDYAINHADHVKILIDHPGYGSI